MRKTLLIATILGGALVSGSAVGNAEPMNSGRTVYGNAPIGHLQPRAQQFPPRSPAEQVEQRNMSISMPSSTSWMKSSTNS